MKRPNSIGDLQKGEKYYTSTLFLSRDLQWCYRYVNMDFFFYSGLKDTAIKCFVVSYDIACQWYKNFYS